MKPPKERFFADPFGFKMDGRLYLMFENYSYLDKKGVISNIVVTENLVVDKAQTVINMPNHMSYPYVFDYKGNIYCIPETGNINNVILFKLNSTEKKWEKCSNLITGKGFIDSTIFYYEGCWWLICTLKEKDPGLNLYAWYAETPFGPWSEHANNPVKTDIGSARPAGTPFYHDKILYRPAQDCSKTYGGKIVINKILELTPTKFKEEVAAVINPYKDSPFKHGIHTISSVGDITLVDSKRDMIAIDWDAFLLYRLIKKVYNMFIHKK